MIRRIVEFLLCDPGGWPRYSKAALARTDEDEARLVERIRKNKPKHPVQVFVLLGLVVAAFPIAYGMDFALRLYLLFLLPLFCLIPAALLRPVLLHGLPANHACAWPMDRKSDLIRRYLGTVFAVSTYWLMSIAIFLNSALMMRRGMGDQWNPLTRTIRLTKTGPYSEYGFVEMVLILSGVFAITGLLWWPMVVFFEWLETRKPNVDHGETAGA
jgi:hypothetical protein